MSMNQEKLGVGDGERRDGDGMDICGGDLSSVSTVVSGSGWLVSLLNCACSVVSVVTWSVSGGAGIRVMAAVSTSGRGITWTSWLELTLVTLDTGAT